MAGFALLCVEAAARAALEVVRALLARRPRPDSRAGFSLLDGFPWAGWSAELPGSGAIRVPGDSPSSPTDRCFHDFKELRIQ